MIKNLLNKIYIEKICEYKSYIKAYTSLEFDNKKLLSDFKLSKKFGLNDFIEDFAKLNFLINYREKLNITNEQLISLLTEIYQKLPANKFEIVHCFNSETTLNSQTKVLILGSITSISGIKNGYFYTSDTNQAMRLLDNVLKENGKYARFENIKQELIFSRKNKQEMKPLVQKLKLSLCEENIAFLDVIEKCIRPVNSSLDDDIIISIPYSADKFYEQIKNSNIKAIFTNSSFVEKYFKKYLNYTKIITELNKYYDKIMSPSPAYLKKFEIKKQDWCDKICKFLK